jgi:hypothetical protein
MNESARDEALTDEQILRCFDGTHFQMSNAECIAAGRRLIALAQPAAEPLAQDDLRAQIFNKLGQISVAGCNCSTKTPDIEHHAERCHYRLAEEIWPLVVRLTAAPPSVGQIKDTARLNWLIKWIGFHDEPPPCRDWADTEDARASIDEAMASEHERGE